MTKAAIYTRLSSWSGETDPSTSPQRQEETCRAYCTAKQWEVVELIADLDVSGTTRGDRLDRRGIVRLRELFPVVDVIVFMRLDRLARNLRDFVVFAEEAAEHDVALVSVQENLDLSTSHGRAFASILASFAQLEAEQLAERTAAGRSAAKKQGRFTGGMVPWGTRVVANPDGGGKVLQPDPIEAPILRDAVHKYLDGMGGTAIARHLNGAKVPTRRGVPWRGPVVMKILQREAEDSIVLSGPERHALREALTARAWTKNTPPTDRGVSLLSSVLRCATCGQSMHRNIAGTRARSTYICNQLAGESTALHARVVAPAADEYVTRVFLEDWSDYRPSVRVIPTAQWDIDIAAAKDTVEALSASLATADRSTRRDIMERLEGAEDALQELLDNPPPRVPIFRRGTKTVGEEWEQASELDRRQLLKKYLGTVYCTPARDDSGHVLPTEERLTIPRIDDAEPDLDRIVSEYGDQN